MFELRLYLFDLPVTASAHVIWRYYRFLLGRRGQVLSSTGRWQYHIKTFTAITAARADVWAFLTWISVTIIPPEWRDKKATHLNFICCLMNSPIFTQSHFSCASASSLPHYPFSRCSSLPPLPQLIMASSSQSLCLHELTGDCVPADRVAVIYLDRLAASCVNSH